MEKIVIRTDEAESEGYLLSLLCKIFPECEIQIVTNAETPGFQGRQVWSQDELKGEEYE